MISAYRSGDSAQVLDNADAAWTHSYPYVKAIWYPAVATVCSLKVINNIVNRSLHIPDLSIGYDSVFSLQERPPLASASTCSPRRRQLDDAMECRGVYAALLTLTFQDLQLTGLDKPPIKREVDHFRWPWNHEERKRRSGCTGNVLSDSSCQQPTHLWWS